MYFQSSLCHLCLFHVNLSLFFAVIFLCFSPATSRPKLPFLVLTPDDIRLLKVSFPPDESGSVDSGSEWIPDPVVDSTTLVEKFRHLASMDINLRQNLLYWTDLIESGERNVIRRKKLNSSVEEPSISVPGAVALDGIAVDWINDKLYWIDSESCRIVVSNLDGTQSTVLLYSGMDMPQSLVVDPLHGYLFWIDYAEGEIERAGMDGTGRRTLISSSKNIRVPNNKQVFFRHLAVDFASDRLFWVDIKEKALLSAAVDGTQVKTVVEGLTEPFSVTVFQNNIFWSEWTVNGIHTCLKHNCSKTSFATTIRPRSIKVITAETQPSRTNPCKSPTAKCSDICLLSPEAPFWKCACATGRKLLPDNLTCPSGPDRLLLIALAQSVRMISLDTPDYTDISIPLRNVKRPMAVDYDPIERMVYFTDNAAKAIRRARLDGSGDEYIVKTEFGNSVGIAVDWVAKNLYWTETDSGWIEVARLNGSSRRILVSKDIVQPLGIVVDPFLGYMYWTDGGGRPKIEKAYLDGSFRFTLVELERRRAPSGLALDHGSGRIYWADTIDDGLIESARAQDGSDRKLYLSGNVPLIFGFSILGDYVYWSDTQRRTIERANKNNASDHLIIREELADINGVKAVDLTSVAGQNLESLNPCAANNGNCSHLCLFRPVGRTCMCPVGLQLSIDGQNCITPSAFLVFSAKSRADISRISVYESTAIDNLNLHNATNPMTLDFDKQAERLYWSDNTRTGSKRISRSFLNGSHEEIILDTGFDNIEGIAVDWIAKNLYWADSGLRRIEAFRISNPHSRRVLIWNHCSPRSIVLDPKQGLMYFGNWVNPPVIERAALDGSGRSPLINSRKRIFSLAIDLVDRRLYWTNVDDMVISSSDLHGGNIRTYEETAGAYTLTQFSDYVYWADGNLNAVFYMHKNAPANKSLVHRNVGLIIDLKAVHYSKQQGSNQCAINNGGCPFLCFVVPSSSSSASEPFLHNYHSSSGSGNRNWNSETRFLPVSDRMDSGAVEKRCGCPTHYDLDRHDKHETKCKAPEHFLLFSASKQIRRLKTTTPPLFDDSEPEAILPIRHLSHVRSLQFDPIGHVMYWLDVRRNKRREEIVIRRATNEESKVEEIRQRPSSLTDIALEPYSRVLFWSCALSNSINATRIGDFGKESKELGTIVSQPGLRPGALAVHPWRGLLFFVNLTVPYSINRCQLDGRKCTVIVSGGLALPVALLVDAAKDDIYWAESISASNQGTISRATIDGSARTVIVNGIRPPTALTIFRNRLLWVDAHTDMIESVEKYEGANVVSISHRHRDLTAVLAVDGYNSKAIREHNLCVRKRCSHLCWLAKENRAQCGCPQGFILDLADGVNCLPRVLCSKSQFACADGRRCIDPEQLCDGVRNCDDESDESHCQNCLRSERRFKCLEGSQCIHLSLFCDGKEDCQDESDERFCRCADPRSNFQCRRMGTDVCPQRESLLCNGIPDCDDQIDEILCPGYRAPVPTLYPATSQPYHELSTTYVVILVLVVLLLIFLAIFVYVCRHKQAGAGASQTATVQVELLDRGGGVVANHRLRSYSPQMYDHHDPSVSSPLLASSNNLGSSVPAPPPSCSTTQFNLSITHSMRGGGGQDHRRGHRSYNHQTPIHSNSLDRQRMYGTKVRNGRSSNHWVSSPAGGGTLSEVSLGGESSGTSPSATRVIFLSGRHQNTPTSSTSCLSQSHVIVNNSCQFQGTMKTLSMDHDKLLQWDHPGPCSSNSLGRRHQQQQSYRNCHRFGYSTRRRKHHPPSASGQQHRTVTQHPHHHQRHAQQLHQGQQQPQHSRSASGRYHYRLQTPPPPYSATISATAAAVGSSRSDVNAATAVGGPPCNTPENSNSEFRSQSDNNSTDSSSNAHHLPPAPPLPPPPSPTVQTEVSSGYSGGFHRRDSAAHRQRPRQPQNSPENTPNYLRKRPRHDPPPSPYDSSEC